MTRTYCTSKAAFDARCRQRGRAYAKAIRRAVVRAEGDRVCLDVDSQGWREAERIVRHGAASMPARPRSRRRRRLPGPGTCLAWAIRIITLGLVRPRSGCGCKERQRCLDRLGWWGVVYGAMGLLGIVGQR